jgi:hypothetical protein
LENLALNDETRKGGSRPEEASKPFRWNKAPVVEGLYFYSTQAYTDFIPYRKESKEAYPTTKGVHISLIA